MQEQLEATPAGRALIHFFLFVTLFSVLITSLPRSGVGSDIEQFPRGYIESTGLEQHWGVFSPDPRNVSLDFRARIVYDDGNEATWTPSGDLFIGALTLYRWRKWYEKATGSAAPDDLSHGAALWIARRHSSPERKVTMVELIQLTKKIALPGDDVVRDWQQETFYRLELESGEADV